MESMDWIKAVLEIYTKKKTMHWSLLKPFHLEESLTRQFQKEPTTPSSPSSSRPVLPDRSLSFPVPQFGPQKKGIQQRCSQRCSVLHVPMIHFLVEICLARLVNSFINITDHSWMWNPKLETWKLNWVYRKMVDSYVFDVIPATRSASGYCNSRAVIMVLKVRVTRTFA